MSKKRQRRESRELPEYDDFIREDRRPSNAPFKPKTKAQEQYLNNIRSKSVTFGVGPAGTGKTFVATTQAADLLAAKKISKLVVTRPIVEAGEQLGFLPGELDEKVLPYFMPVLEILQKRLGGGTTAYHLKAGNIVFQPLAYMRGMTFDNSFVLLDEAQNTTPSQMKLFLSRIGENTTYVIDGDPRQVDIKGPSGLCDGLDRIGGYGWCGVTRFNNDDIVRSGVARDVIISYQNEREDGEEQYTLPGFITD